MNTLIKMKLLNLKMSNKQLQGPMNTVIKRSTHRMGLNTQLTLVQNLAQDYYESHYSMTQKA